MSLTYLKSSIAKPSHYSKIYSVVVVVPVELEFDELESVELDDESVLLDELELDDELDVSYLLISAIA